MELDQMLDGQETPPPSEEQAPVVEAPPEPPKDETPPGNEAPAGMPPAPPSTMPYAAYKAEKEKRQQLEQELQQRFQQQQDQQQKPGFWEQPEQHLDSVRNDARLQALAVKLDVTEEMARGKYQDYDQQLETFGKLVESNPHLRVQMLQARNPAEFAYSVAKNHASVQEAGSIESLREKIRAEERAKIEAEMRTKADADAKKRDAIPNTLTDVQSGAPRSAEFLGPTSLDAILK